MTELGRAAAEDGQGVVELVNALLQELGGAPVSLADGYPAVQKLVSEPEAGFVLVARDAGALVGACTVSFQHAVRTRGRYAIAQEMYVRPERRGQGLGTGLLEAAITEARRAGCSTIELATPPAGERQEKFYRRLGFAPVGPRLRKLLDEP